MKRLLVAITWVVLLVTACSSPSGSTRTTIPKTAPNPLVGKDERIRPVPTLSGEALTYVRPDTASQVICQALSFDQWQQVTGGPVGRYPASAGPHQPCLIATTVNLRFFLADRTPGWQSNTTFGGRPARTDAAKNGALTATVTLVDDASRPVLQVEPLLINRLSTADQQRLLTTVLNRLVPVLARPSKPMPKADGTGELQFVKARPPAHGGIVDEPSPLQALELCTTLVDHAGYTPAQVTPLVTGSCQGRKPGKEPLTLAITDQQRPTDSYNLNVADRPASEVVDDSQATNIRLVDGAFIDFTADLPYEDPLLTTIVRALMS